MTLAGQFRITLVLPVWPLLKSPTGKGRGLATETDPLPAMVAMDAISVTCAAAAAPELLPLVRRNARVSCPEDGPAVRDPAEASSCGLPETAAKCAVTV